MKKGWFRMRGDGTGRTGSKEACRHQSVSEHTGQIVQWSGIMRRHVLLGLLPSPSTLGSRFQSLLGADKVDSPTHRLRDGFGK